MSDTENRTMSSAASGQGQAPRQKISAEDIKRKLNASRTQTAPSRQTGSPAQNGAVRQQNTIQGQNAAVRQPSVSRQPAAVKQTAAAKQTAAVRQASTVNNGRPNAGYAQNAYRQQAVRQQPSSQQASRQQPSQQQSVRQAPRQQQYAGQQRQQPVRQTGAQQPVRQSSQRQAYTQQTAGRQYQQNRQQTAARRGTASKQTAVKKSGKGTVLKRVLQVLAVVLTVILVLFGILVATLGLICSGISPAAQKMAVTTFLETGQMKFVPSWFLSSEKIDEIVNSNKMEEFNEEVDVSLINVGGKGSVGIDIGSGAEEEDIYVIEIPGTTYYANMIVVKDPSRVSVATIYPWRAEGVTLDTLVKDSGAIAGINGGLYNSYNNSGGAAYGVVVSNGEIQLNEPNQWPGLVLIGLTEDNILQIINIDGMSRADVEYLITSRKIRDAVTFQEESSDVNNHFVQLVINGEAREMNGTGSGLNPRTAIGQRADGAILLLVTDGRGKSGHLGASASDLINIMLEYGAVNAANLDGGSSSCMYYEDQWLMTSVTFYYSKTSWKLPLAFVVK